MDFKESTVINGELFENMILGGAANLHENMQTVNDLNVFPIPDGDTGTNMFLTMKGGLDQLKTVDSLSLADKANALAQGMLLGARGNSGVILSQLFFGMASELSKSDSATVDQFALALEKGVACAYSAVAIPVEGTMLTVAREAAAYARSQIVPESTVADFIDHYLSEMKRSLERTPELLNVLKEAGVIDSGGAGLVYIVEGFLNGIGGKASLTSLDAVSANDHSAVDLSKFNEDSEMVFGYCTELLLQLQTKKIQKTPFSLEALTSFLQEIGDSVVAFQTGTVVKIHVHTMTPYRVLEYCQTFGEYLTIKIENMTLQHNETIKEDPKPAEMPKVKRARRPFAVVTVAMGEGLVNAFKELGADKVINGGQTSNPSAEIFLEAFDEVNADHIFVLPNNSNIILAAKQAAELYHDSEIHIIESKSIGQGYSALSMLDYSSNDPSVIEKTLIESMQGVSTGMVSKSIRTTSVNGVSIEEGNYMGFTDKTMMLSAPSRIDVVKGLVDRTADEKEFIIAIYGNEVDKAERRTLNEYVVQNYPHVEFYEIEGGQAVYDYILILE